MLVAAARKDSVVKGSSMPELGGIGDLAVGGVRVAGLVVVELHHVLRHPHGVQAPGFDFGGHSMEPFCGCKRAGGG